MGLWKSLPSGVDAILNQPRRSLSSRFVSNPLTTIAKYLHDLFPILSPPEELGLTVVCVSDTHNTHPRIPTGDILIHAGDLTVSGTKEEVQNTLDWVRRQPHRYKIVIAGNHDLYLDEKLRNPETSGDELDWGDVVYLNHTSATLRFGRRTVKVFGSPWTPKHGSGAFQYPRSAALNPYTGAVPADTGVLVTHAPPKGHLDDAAGHWGCEKLLEEVWRVRPRLCVFGHVHCGRGVERVAFDEVQRAWERVVWEESRGRRWSWGGLWAVVRMVRVCVGVAVRGGGRVGKGVFVNAAAIGGWRDTEVYEGIVVRI